MEDRLLSALSTKTHKVSKQFIQVVNENLVHRRRLRLQPSARSGIDSNPEWVVPPACQWSGGYVDLPSNDIANPEYEVQYNIIFKVDGTVEGSGSSTEGGFTIQGAYHSRTGIVTWRQVPASCPVWHNPCTKYGARVESEFSGKVSNFTGPGPARVTGTFLTELGRYCAVNLVCSAASEKRTGLRSPATEAEALPTLLTTRLTGRWMPIVDDSKSPSSGKRRLQSQRTVDSDTLPPGYTKASSLQSQRTVDSDSATEMEWNDTLPPSYYHIRGYSNRNFSFLEEEEEEAAPAQFFLPPLPRVSQDGVVMVRT